jgi:putative copper export protein
VQEPLELALNEMHRILVLLHILGASVWVGGHLVLSLTVLPRALRARDPRILLDFEAGYERIGMPALVLQVVSGVWLATYWAPDVSSWFAPSTPQTWFILAKLALLATTLALAAHARLRLIPKLDAGNLPLLAGHIIAVTLLGIAFVVLGVAVRTGSLF